MTRNVCRASWSRVAAMLFTASACLSGAVSAEAQFKPFVEITAEDGASLWWIEDIEHLRIEDQALVLSGWLNGERIEWAFPVTAGTTIKFPPLDASAVEADPALVEAPRLLPAWPNPTRGALRMSFSLPSSGDVDLAVIDASGRVVRHVLEGRLDAGQHSVSWDGRDACGRTVPHGVYFCRLRAPEGQHTRSIVVMP